MKVLIFNPGYTDRCGVYAHGRRMFDILKGTPGIDYHYVEVTSEEEMRRALTSKPWSAVFYNYYPGTMDWLPEMHPRAFPGVQMGLIHEVTQETVESPPDTIFDGWVITDPSLDLKGRDRHWFQTVRPLPPLRTGRAWYLRTPKPLIGTFGFAFPNKGFEKVARAVNAEFDEAVLKVHITQNHYSGGVPLGDPAAIRAQIEAEITKEGIEVDFSDEFVTDEQLVEKLSLNDLNCLFYDRNPGRGISSAVDYCVASGTRLLISDSEQFRHVKHPALHYPNMCLRMALDLKFNPVQDLQEEWGHERFRKDYAGIIKAVLS